MASPVVEFRNPTTPFAVITSIGLTGTGFGGAIPVGSASSVFNFRIYNNFAAAGSIGDALMCALASYDDATHQGQGTTSAVIGRYLQVNITDYNGSTSGGDGSTYFPVGGQVKHTVPVNSATLAGAASNYITVNVKAVVPPNATQGSFNQGLWLEYSSTS
ncbi:MAG: hypothetical protein ACJ788_00090 [Ktedonobacteraceae bacterium]